MSNPGQPTIKRGDTGTAVLRAQRALRRTPDLSVDVDGDFGPDTEAGVKRFQKSAGLKDDGIVGDETWEALPSGGPMPLLKTGSKGDVVRDLQEVLIAGADSGDWPSPGEADGDFGAGTKKSVEGFQKWGGVDTDGIVGDKTWAVPLHATNSTLETAVGLDWADD
ncbi:MULTISPECIES: peptidoglycan-binding domain-containing protein [unclassified Brevibacterium]|uniref:peptidoglycan-binding domain-containing protein n=1 Tax=unclassified Brevibacterium TaxID=2614124 RepID=UPI001092FCCA|nr:peptidoglycan-binding protein [Brevibacterium sp. S22]TGD28698.1 peptidoglycan-binding protein [Brevibacterium sp. S22]